MPVSFRDSCQRTVSVARGEATTIKKFGERKEEKKPPMEELVVLLISELKADRWTMDAPLSIANANVGLWQLVSSAATVLDS
jgi:hypothetical protein